MTEPYRKTNVADGLEVLEQGEAMAGSPQSLRPVIGRIAELLGDLAPSFALERKRLDGLRERLNQGRFHLAVLGQFKRGKSTLLNALVGQAVLPTSVVPLTSVPTFLSSGLTWQVRVSYVDGRVEDIPTDSDAATAAEVVGRYVTEESNPRNVLGVSQVEISLPSPFLARGVVLIDTPGIGSTHRHNTEATLAFLPQCDAALFLVSADPPITEVEVDFLKEVRQRVPRLFFVLNKLDYLDEGEREKALAFLGKVLREQGALPEPLVIFPLSARLALEARRDAKTELWNESGAQRLEVHLLDFLAREKTAALEVSVARRLRDLLADASLQLNLTLNSLTMPLEDLEKRQRAFQEKIHQAKRQEIMAGDLLKGERSRALAFLEERVDKLRREAHAHFREFVETCAGRTAARALSEERVEAYLAEEIPPFFERALTGLTREVDQAVQKALEPVGQLADHVVEDVRATAAHLFDIPYHSVTRSVAFEMVRAPHWDTHTWSCRLNPIPRSWVDQMFPGGMKKRRILKRLHEEVRRLVVKNFEDLRWSTLQGINDTFIRFRSALGECFEETITATHGAMEAARLKREQHKDETAGEIERIRAAVRKAEELTVCVAALDSAPRAAQEAGCRAPDVLPKAGATLLPPVVGPGAEAPVSRGAQ